MRQRRLLAAALGSVALIGAAAVAWRVLTPAAAEVRRARDQNVLLISIDTLRADALGAAGGRAATPNLDRLAALGVRFDFAHAHAPLTLPSHASILTGLYPFQHGIHDNAGFRLPASTPTLASRLAAEGMATGAFIASFPLDSRFGLSRGFDVYEENYGRSNVSSGFTIPERRADAVVAAACEWIRRQPGPWFAFVHLFDPHAPYDPPAPFDGEYASRPYDGEVAFTDAALAPLLDLARDRSGRPTFVIATSDHGEGLGDHGEATHGLFAYESTLRIPLILAQVDRATAPWPAGSPARATPTRRSPVSARHIDLVPTVLDALGLPPPADLPGRSLLPGASGPDHGDRPSYFEAWSASYNRGWARLTGVLAGGEKYIDLPVPELYDLKRDPAESANLVSRGGERLRALEGLLQRFEAASVPVPREEQAELRARLRALGYVSGHAPPKARYGEDDDPKRLVDVDRRLRAAIELYERRRPLEAIPIYREIIAERPMMEVTYTQLAMLQWELGRPDEAIATLRASMEAGCGGVTVRATLGTYLAESNRTSEAIPLLQDATSGDDADVEALNALGIALGRASKARDAEQVFQRILRVNPGNTMALENLGALALSGQRLAEARRLFERALSSDPASAQAHNGLGAVERQSGNREAAIAHFRAAVERDPQNFDALFNAGSELAEDGQFEAARPYLERFAATAPPAFYARDIQRVRERLARLSR